MAELVVMLLTLVKQFIGGRRKQNGCLSWELCIHIFQMKTWNDDNDENVKKFNSDDDFVGKLFLRLLHRDQTCGHSNRKGIYILNYKRFIINLNNYLNDDLPNALNCIRVSLASSDKILLKQIADHINDSLMIKIQSFSIIRRYLMASDIIETKLFKEPKKMFKKSIPKCKCNLIFKSKTFGFINPAKIKRSVWQPSI